MLDKDGEPLMKLVKPEISCIPHNFEKFMTFSIGEIKFIDSMKFMNTSLEKLTENLYDDNDKYKKIIS